MRSTEPASQQQIDNRLDLKLIDAFNKTDNPARLRKYLLQQASELPEWRRLLPSRVLTDIAPAPPEIALEFDQKALVSQLDYHFERRLLPTMSPKQAADYMLAVKDRLTISVSSLQGPLVLESMHHTLTFSAMYSVLVHLVENEGYNHLIMMHQHPNPDPRVLLQALLLESKYGLKTGNKVHFDRTWFREVKRNLTPQSIIITMGDLPSPQGTSNKELALSLPSIDGHQKVYRQQTYSVGERIKQKLSCTHLVCDYPDNNILLSYNDSAPLRCPITDWIFWPTINDIFREGTHDS